jgi:hypothetical protein
MSAIDPNGLACEYLNPDGTVSVDNTGGASGASGVCAAYGGTYVSGWVDSNTLSGVLPGQYLPDTSYGNTQQNRTPPEIHASYSLQIIPLFHEMIAL